MATEANDGRGASRGWLELAHVVPARAWLAHPPASTGPSCVAAVRVSPWPACRFLRWPPRRRARGTTSAPVRQRARTRARVARPPLGHRSPSAPMTPNPRTNRPAGGFASRAARGAPRAARATATSPRTEGLGVALVALVPGRRLRGSRPSAPPRPREPAPPPPEPSPERGGPTRQMAVRAERSCQGQGPRGRAGTAPGVPEPSPPSATTRAQMLRTQATSAPAATPATRIVSNRSA